jgi:Phosphopantetheine attachment site
VKGKVEPQNITGSVAEMSVSSGFSVSDIPSDVFETVRTKVAEIKKIDKNETSFDTNLVLDLHADSLDMAELKSAIQSLFPSASNPPI